jgi:hypothetical protein
MLSGINLLRGETKQQVQWLHFDIMISSCAILGTFGNLKDSDCIATLDIFPGIQFSAQLHVLKMQYVVTFY